MDVESKNVLFETQEERDLDLSIYFEVPILEIKKMKIASPQSIKIYKNEDLDVESFDFLYKDYKYLNIVDYIRTLSARTISNRAKYIHRLKNIIGSFRDKMLLDYGSGVGTHGIACAQMGAMVDFVDIDGPLKKYAQWKANKKGINNIKFLNVDVELENGKYDIVLCLDVLEHIFDPIEVFKKITKSLKLNGFLVLEVSKMIKPTSGHFAKSINEWKKEGNKLLHANYIKISRNIWKKIHE